MLHAYARSDDLRALALHGEVAQILAQLMGSDQVQLSQCHHNCVMTKYPGFSSATLWHQDIRYWSFDRPELISVWYAVGDELADNGALSVIPGTHVENFGRGRLDRNLFLRPELEENQRLIEQAKVVELAAGDALFFHCRLFHAAGRNLTDQVKISPVFTYHAQNNQPIPETSSDRLPSIMLSNAS
ncbi:phytanoyl-CoA dioxygenase family protein [Pseudomonadales bacterium]|nr:phytanoyl-CoA dioxygenase family protein [Pseudomonadales bacterium]